MLLPGKLFPVNQSAYQQLCRTHKNLTCWNDVGTRLRVLGLGLAISLCGDVHALEVGHVGCSHVLAGDWLRKHPGLCKVNMLVGVRTLRGRGQRDLSFEG